MSELIIPFHGGKLVVPEKEAVQAWLDKVMASTEPQFEAPRAVPQIGEYWDGQGGIYAGVMPIENGGFAHRIVSTDEAEDLEYGGYNHSVSGATSKINGYANTLALLADSEKHPAARWCADYGKDGHSDFYLPAQRELSLAWATIEQVFGPHWYWSSTQSSDYRAWYQSFSVGYALNLGKSSTARVRAFRRLEFTI